MAARVLLSGIVLVGTVVRSLRAGLLWARQELERWSWPVITTTRMSQVTAGVVVHEPGQSSP